MTHHPDIAEALRESPTPLVVDLGYGARPDTTVEMARWLRRIVDDLPVTGLEIDPERVVDDREGVHFALGGFELAGLRPTLVRAFNVLRQYDEDEVGPAWSQMQSALAPGGLIVEGTCDEIGRRCSWVLLDEDRPRTLTLAWSPEHTDRPSTLAERLPKALIHRNVPGEPIHDLLTAADRAWELAAPLAPFGPRQRWRRATQILRDMGVDCEVSRTPTRDNILTVGWDTVAPLG
ncbi:hypothetical protein GCM10027169_06610 [Gordonia jinhuaensis]|uniref:Methylase n=1 Tax=Gordonia jinhuaensis TaxID=1517702 RepID=A0A916SYW8_9ACTN|nr:class I SAM-dependent methyltransferase [Gordonia jinhuaensis]GGB20847.1 hypothetical protein GCM10011489_06210 [Gordonia jinhuaensis]